MITITQDKFKEVATSIAAKVAHDVHDVKIGLILTIYASLVSKELFKKEDK